VGASVARPGGRRRGTLSGTGGGRAPPAGCRGGPAGAGREERVRGGVSSPSSPCRAGSGPPGPRAAARGAGRRRTRPPTFPLRGAERWWWAIGVAAPPARRRAGGGGARDGAAEGGRGGLPAGSAARPAAARAPRQGRGGGPGSAGCPPARRPRRRRRARARAREGRGGAGARTCMAAAEPLAALTATAATEALAEVRATAAIAKVLGGGKVLVLASTSGPFSPEGEVSLTPVSLAGRTRMKASLAVRFPKSGILSRSETPFRPLGGSERRSPRGRTKVSEGPPYPDTERGTREGLQAGQPLQLQLRRWERTGRGGFSPSPPRRRGGGKGPSERFSIPLRRSVCRRRSLGARGGDHATGPGAISHDMRKSGGSIHPQKPSDLGSHPKWPECWPSEPSAPSI